MDAVRRTTLEQMKLANADMMSIGGIGCFSDDAMKSQMVCIVNKSRSNNICIHADHYFSHQWRIPRVRTSPRTRLKEMQCESTWTSSKLILPRQPIFRISE
eukprot:scaffold266059_cov86-Cyclotella_meneghiniana.AAC.1